MPSIRWYLKHFTDNGTSQYGFKVGRKTANKTPGKCIKFTIFTPKVSRFWWNGVSYHLQFLISLLYMYIPNLIKDYSVVLEKKTLTFNAWRTIYDDGSKPIASGHLSDSGNIMTDIFCRTFFEKRPQTLTVTSVSETLHWLLVRRAHICWPFPQHPVPLTNDFLCSIWHATIHTSFFHTLSVYQI